MTLAEWAKHWPFPITYHHDATASTFDSILDSNRSARTQAFTLSDYVVTSVVGGIIQFRRERRKYPRFN